MIFSGGNRIRYNYSRYGWTRGGGKTWHGGMDVEGIDSDRICMPYYRNQAICGTVTRARIVTDKRNPTWEWGNYVCVRLDQNQTPDAVNYLYFCHCRQLLAREGDYVKSGDVLALMGKTGNAALADPPYAHCHFEVRATACGKGMNPVDYAGIPNQTGTYTVKEGSKTTERAQPKTVLTVRQGVWYLRATPGSTGTILGTVQGGHRYEVEATHNGWCRLARGWLGPAGVASLTKEEAHTA